MAGAYLVQVDPECGQTLVGAADGMVVYAADATDALAICAAKYGGSPKSMWDNATATAIAAGADLEGWRLRVAILGEGVDVTVTGAASATVDSIGALAVTALNATTPVSNAAYNASTNVLTIAGTGDSLGDAQVLVEMYPPTGGAFGNPDVAIPSFVGTIVDGGSSGSALTAVLVQSTIPTIAAAITVR